MIRLRTLGSIGLVADDAGAPLTAVLRQPKRLALLAYLALARPRGFQRRDALLALFWPELDDERGRAALRQALYTLKRELPVGTIRTRGDGEIGLEPGALWCDVHAMEAAAAEGRPAEALALYWGDLLAGFHVPDASHELDEWLSAERDRLRQIALSAAADAAREAEASGDLERAIAAAARAVEIAPLDESAVRREMRLRHGAGDRPGALLAFEHLTRRLEEELGLDPSPATSELAAELRTTPPPEVRTPPPRPAPRSRDRVGAAAGSSAEPPPAPPPPHRRRWQIVLVSASVLLLAGLSTLVPIRLDWRDGAAAPAGARVMVLPFSYRGGGEGAYLSEGLVYLFSVALDGEDLRTLDPNGLIRRATEAGVEEFDPAAAAALADRLEASHFLLGSVVETEGGLQLDASLYELGASAPVARGTAAGPPEEVMGLVDAVAAELLATRESPVASRIARLAAVTSSSLPAVKAYLAGERLMRKGRYDAAIGAFQTAVAEDSFFALAHYRTSQAASWAFRGELATDAAARAVRHADRLPDHERRLLLGHEAYRRGEGGRALEILRELSVHYPDDPEVWYRLAEVRMHFGPLIGRPIEEARAPFLRTLRLDSTYTDAFYHLAQLAALAGEEARALEYVHAGLEAAPASSRAPQLRVLRSALLDGADHPRRLHELAAADDFTVVSSVYNAAVYGGRPDFAKEIALLLVAPGRPPGTRAFGHLLLADLEIALGRWTAADARLDSVRAIDPDRADRHRALLMAAPAARPAPGAGEAVLARLAEGGSARGPAEPAVLLEPENRFEPLPRLYSLGILAALLGRSAELDTAVAALSRETEFGDHANDLRLLAAAHGDVEPPPVGAPHFDCPVEETVLTPFLSRPARRYLEARRLERRGQLREALVWYESLGVFSLHDLPWGIPALLDRARLHERLGEDEAAARLYQRFAVLWAGADDAGPRTSALERLARLRGAGS